MMTFAFTRGAKPRRSALVRCAIGLLAWNGAPLAANTTPDAAGGPLRDLVTVGQLAELRSELKKALAKGYPYRR